MRIVGPALLLIALVGLPAQADAARTLRLGIFDPVFVRGTAAQQSEWLGRTRTDGGRFVRIQASWATISPTRPAQAADPADPAYRWAAIDAAVRAAVVAGLEPLVTLSGAPRWAEGDNRPGGVARGAWRPDATAYGAFARAAAQRYSGTQLDPAAGTAALPRVRLWQAWNEPNLATYVAPQWESRDGVVVPASPALYRALLNAMTDAVHSVHADNVAITAGTAPFGNSEPGGQRLRPVRFWKELLCVKGHTGACGQVRMDAFAHHPYGVRRPTASALYTEDVAVPDVHRIIEIVRAAERMGRVLSPGHRAAWVTEVSYDSSPPDPDGVPAAEHAQWLSETLYLLWRQGVSAVAWFRIVDQPPFPSYAATSQSGLYLLDGRAKPAATAFAFPLVAVRRGGRTRVWGMAPTAGTVRVERLVAGRWHTVKRVAATGGRVFFSRVRVKPHTLVRGVAADGRASRPYRVPR